MWALQRAYNPIKKGVGVKTYRLLQAALEGGRCNRDGQTTGLYESVLVVYDKSRFVGRGYSSSSDSQNLFRRVRKFSSQTGSMSKGDEDDDLKEGFSEIEASTDADAIQDKNVGDNLVSEVELSREESRDATIDFPEDEGSLIDKEGDVYENQSSGECAQSELFDVIADTHSNLSGVLDKWVQEGNEITSTEILEIMRNLQKRRMYFKALQLSEWSHSRKHLEFSERDYACHLDLIAKVHSVAQAENYIQKIPQSSRTEVVYGTLLKNHVACSNVKKAEDVFKKMKNLGFPVTSFTCNQLLLLYKRHDKKKIADVLSLMEKEDIKPSPFTYKLLIDTKGRSGDFVGMEQIFETMKAEGVMPDLQTQATMARHYISGCLKEKAETVLKEMEFSDLKENRFACPSLISLYAALGKAEEVKRIWQVCDSNPYLNECTSAIEAWGKLKNVEEAEAIFEKMTTKYTKLTSKHYTVLLKVYAENKMLAKGKDLLNHMADKDFRMGPLTWDAIVKLYIEAGKVETADSLLQELSETSRMKPLYNSYLTIMEHYAKRGDVHNTEKMFHRMKLAGCLFRCRHFESLLKAYAIAKTPAYGFYDRMKAENVLPTKGFREKLSRNDPFRKSEVSKLLD